MAFKTKIDKKTGKTMYAWRYYIYENGKKKDTNTKYYPTKEEAEAIGRRTEREIKYAVDESATRRRDKHLITAFSEFIDDYEKRSTRKTTDNTCSDKAFFNRAKTIRKMYMPEAIQKVKMQDLEALTFRDWLTHINSQDIAGSYVRSLRATLSLFNKWLRTNGYYDDRNLDIEIDYALSKTTIKAKRVKNREDKGERNILTIADIDNICDYFFQKGIGKFENFYFYTLYYVLFYSGIRVEELVGLQWKFINLDDGVMEIKNAINQRELRENVMNRVKQNIYHTKNTTSVRILPILENYRELLLDYKTSFKYEFGVSDEELEECFVFPMLVKHNPHIYLNADLLTRKLKEALNELGLKNTDCQMFRHSCATFLIMPYPEGLEFDEQKVIDYFGHTDTEMLRTVYARLNTIQKGKRLKKTFGEYYKDEKSDKTIEEENEQIRRIETIKGNTDIAKKARKERMIAEIERAIKKKQKVYYYIPKDEWVIDEIKNDYIGKIKFKNEN